MICNRRESPSPFLLKADQSFKTPLCPLGPQRQEQGITSTQFLGGTLLLAGAIKCHVACNSWETASSLPIGAGTTTPLCLQQSLLKDDSEAAAVGRDAAACWVFQRKHSIKQSLENVLPSLLVHCPRPDAWKHTLGFTVPS